MKTAKIILIIFLAIKTLTYLAESVAKGDLGEFLGVLLGTGIKAYLYYLVGIFNL